MTQIYQDHDTSYQLKVIGDKIREMKQEKNKKRGQVLEIGKSLGEMYFSDQAIKTKEALGTDAYKYNPDYLRKNFLEKSITPFKDKVAVDPAFKAKNPENWKEMLPDIGLPKEGEGLLDKFNLQNIQSTTQDITSNISSKFTPTTLAAGGVLSAIDLAMDWDKKSNLDKVFGLGKTALGAAGGLGMLASGPVGWGMLGLQGLDWLID